MGGVGRYDIPVSGEVVTTESGVAALGTILGIWAHPDDEAYLSGGLMAMARNHGSRVVCVTATRGELGTPDPVAWAPVRLAAERTGELARGLEILGVTEHHWLGYADGACADVPAAEAVERLRDLIEEVALRHGADLRPGRHHRSPGPPGGLRLDGCGLQSGRPPDGPAAAGGRRRSPGVTVE